MHRFQLDSNNNIMIFFPLGIPIAIATHAQRNSHVFTVDIIKLMINNALHTAKKPCTGWVSFS